MSKRITMKFLEGMIDRLNIATGGTTKVWITDESGNTKSRDGAYVLDAAYGGYRLSQIVGDSGAEREITPRGTARATADGIDAYTRGMDAGYKLRDA